MGHISACLCISLAFPVSIPHFAPAFGSSGAFKTKQWKQQIEPHILTTWELMWAFPPRKEQFTLKPVYAFFT